MRNIDTIPNLQFVQAVSPVQSTQADAHDADRFKRLMARQAPVDGTGDDGSGVTQAQLDKAIGDTIMGNIIRDTFRWQIRPDDIA